MGLLALCRLASDTPHQCRDQQQVWYGEGTAVVLFNDHDELAGSLDANVAVRIQDTWLTPPRGCGNAVSAFQVRLVETGVLREAVVTRDRFETADQVALLDDVYGWRIVDLAG